jgi:hypothetical protein
MEEMTEVEKLVFDLQNTKTKEETKAEVADIAGATDMQKNYVMKHVSDLKYKLTAKTSSLSSLKPCRKCCCFSHCLFAQHGTVKSSKVEDLKVMPCPQYMFPGMFDRSWSDLDVYEEMVVEVHALVVLHQHQL